MRVLVLGGTGTVGSAIVRALIAAGHEVAGLARSPAAAERLMAAGAEPVAGDLNAPRLWTDAVMDDLDAVVHAACTFADGMGAADDALMDALLPALAATGRRPTLIYTGGCWLWGPSQDREIAETTPFDPLPAFAWMVANAARTLGAQGIRGAVVHPAMVYADAAGPFAGNEGPIRLVGSQSVLWPLVHADDLADLYRRVLEDAAFTGHVIGVADAGIPVGDLARRAARHRADRPVELLVVPEDRIAEERGEWARGFARSQRMSGTLARTRLGWSPKHSLAETVPA